MPSPTPRARGTTVRTDVRTASCGCAHDERVIVLQLQPVLGVPVERTSRASRAARTSDASSRWGCRLAVASPGMRHATASTSAVVAHSAHMGESFDVIVVVGGRCMLRPPRRAGRTRTRDVAARNVSPSGMRTEARAAPPGSSGSCTTPRAMPGWRWQARPALESSTTPEARSCCASREVSTSGRSAAARRGGRVVRRCRCALRPGDVHERWPTSPSGDADVCSSGRCVLRASRTVQGSRRDWRARRGGSSGGRQSHVSIVPRQRAPRSSRSRARGSRLPTWWSRRGHGLVRCSRPPASTSRSGRAGAGDLLPVERGDPPEHAPSTTGLPDRSTISIGSRRAKPPYLVPDPFGPDRVGQGRSSPLRSATEADTRSFDGDLIGGPRRAWVDEHIDAASPIGRTILPDTLTPDEDFILDRVGPWWWRRRGSGSRLQVRAALRAR